MAEELTRLPEIEVFTESYWISGRLSREQSSDAASLASLLNLGEYGLSGRGLLESSRLVDILNRDAGYLSVAGATVRSLHVAERLERSVPLVAVNLSEILCAAPFSQAPRAGTGGAPPPPGQFERERRRVEVQTGPIQVTGDLHVLPGSDPVAGFFRRERMFVPLTSSTAVYLPDPERRWDREVLIVNVFHTQLMMVATPLPPDA